ncbi:uncharacterized protein [Engystomops pustulosus]|uniref:uncharacterized protein isoform X3 n=1 Tax=Engystomops pustulosus TaxID=76066 RepID=UPI003AFAA1F4
MSTPEPPSPPLPGNPPGEDAGVPGAGGGLLEEELWLYGADSPNLNHDDENASSPGHTNSCDKLQDTSSGSAEHKDNSLQIAQSCSDDDSDTDSDDVRVTIGDIRTGAPTCMGPTANQSMKGGRGYSAAGKLPPKGIDFSAPGNINGLPVLEVDLDSFEEKPWRKPGADLSDYFNYGFNEATWKVYCEKQRRLQLGLDSANPHSKENKITVQQGRAAHTSKGDHLFDNSDLNLNIDEGKRLINAKQNGEQAKAIDVIGGEICSITRVEGRRWEIQDSDDIPTQRPPPASPAPPPLHPPALLLPPPPPLVHPPAVHIPPPSGPPVTYNNRPPPQPVYFSNGPGAMTYTAVSTAPTSWVTTVDKSTSSPGRREWTPRNRQERDMNNTRSQHFIHYKPESERPVNYSRVRSYDYDCKYRRNRECSWEKEEKIHGEHRQRDREESSKHKSSRRKQDSEERESHRRHKRKKSKRSKDKSVDDDPAPRGSRHDLREKSTSASGLGSV